MSEEREIPCAQGPEKSVLSSLMKSQAIRIRAAADGLTEDHFHLPAHRLLFRTFRSRDAAGLSDDLVALFEDLRRDGELDSVGGPSYLTEIYTYATNDHHFDGHLQMLRQSLARRRAMVAAMEIADRAATADPEDLAKALTLALEGTTTALQHDSGVVTAKKAVASLARQLEALQAEDASVPGLPTGLLQIDLVTGGIWPVELWVVAAETSGGKSVVMLQAALSALREGKRVFVVSLEMEASAVAGRMISNLKSVPNDTWRKPKLASPTNLQRAFAGMKELEAMPLTIDDKGGRTIDQIAGLAQAEIDRYGKLDLIVVDYIQRIEVNAVKGQSRAQELSHLSKKLKSLAMRLRVPVFTASQLNDDGRLFDSRAIGHDADVVLRVTDEGIIGDKVRNGPRDQLFPLVLNGEFQRFQPRN